MPLACTYDGSVGSYCASCIDSRKAAEVGVLIGWSSGGRAAILKLAPTPPQEGSPPVSLQQGGGGGGGSASNLKKQGAKAAAKAAPAGGLIVDREWVVEHAAQVQDMLPGGLAVLGLYLLCPEPNFAGASAQLLSLLGEVQQELEDKGASGLLLLHIDAVAGKLAAREFTGGAAGSLKPCELKSGSLLPSLVAVHCRLELSLAVQLANPKQRLRDALAVAVQRELQQRVQLAVGLLSGRPQPMELPLQDLAPGGAGPLQAELLLPPAAASAAVLAPGAEGGGLLQRGKGRVEAVGSLRLEGALDCRAYLQKRAGAGAAVEALKQDVARTLRVRQRMLADAAEQQAEEAAGAQPPLLRRVGEAAAPVALALPRRVFVEAAPGAVLCFCDHLFEGESDNSVTSRAEELLGVPQGELGHVECREAARLAASKRGAAAAAGRAKAAGGDGRAGGGAAAACNVVAAGAVAAAGLALIIGYWTLGQ